MNDQAHSSQGPSSEDTKVKAFFTETWPDKPENIPFPLKMIRISPDVFAPGKGKPVLRTQVETSNHIPDEITGFIKTAYNSGVLEKDKATGQIFLFPNHSIVTWNDLWRVPAETSVTIRHILFQDGMCIASEEYGFVTDKTLSAEWIATITPRFWKIYDGNSGGPKLHITIKRIVTSGWNGEYPEFSFRYNRAELTRLAADWKIPSLEKYLNERFRSAQTKITGSKISLQYDSRTNFSDEDRNNCLVTQARTGKSLRIPVTFCVKNAHPISLELEIVPYKNPFLGLVAIDFGNSASSIVVHDPGKHDTPSSLSLPSEQKDHLRESLIKWFQQPIQAIKNSGISESVWMEEFLGPLADDLELSHDDPATVLGKHLIGIRNQGSVSDNDFFILIKHLELALNNLHDVRDRRILREAMYHFYHDAFLQFPFRLQNMTPMHFASEERNSGVDYTPSDLELTAVQPIPDGNIGLAAQKKRQEWMRKSSEGDMLQTNDTVREYQQWFSDCPKRYLRQVGRAKTIPVGNLKKKHGGGEFYPRDIVQAAWHALLREVDDHRAEYRFSDGPLQHVVTTYPADLMPEPRRSIESLFAELGALYTDTLFDEAVSPAIFYFEQRFGNSNELGSEAFKVRCTQLGNRWFHNMLILDIGAGTTDIAVVQFVLSEDYSAVTPSNGGRVYTISPKLLGASGRDQAGGNLITLKMFRRLKVLLAEYLIKQINPSAVETIPEGLDFELTDGVLGNSIYGRLMDYVEGILPTRYAGKDISELLLPADEIIRRKDRFYALWDWAERLKIEFSNSMSDPHNSLKTFGGIALNSEIWDMYKDRILDGTKYAKNFDLVLSNDLRFPFNDFESLAKGVIGEAVSTAVELAEESLKAPIFDEPILETNTSKMTIDSIVLSGRASQMSQVRELMEEQIRSNDKFASNRTEILFQSDFAKVATAAGACRGKRILQQALVGNKTVAKGLQAGLCKQDLDIQNLFFYLPTSFKDDDGQTLFKMHSKFKQFDFDGIGRIRSDSFSTAIQKPVVSRCDGSQPIWGSWDTITLAKSAGMPHHEFVKGLMVQYEINHNLQLDILLLRSTQNINDPPYYLLKAEKTPLQFHSAIKNDAWKHFLDAGRFPENLKHPIFLGEPLSSDAHPIFPAGTSFDSICIRPESVRAINGQIDAENGLFEREEHEDKRLVHRITVPVTDVDEISEEINEADRDRAKVEALEAGLVKMCWTKDALPAPNTNAMEYDFYTKLPDGEILHLTKIRLNVTKQNEGNLSFEFDYRLMLTQDGTISVFIGNTPPYWETTDIQEWASISDLPGIKMKNSPRIVYRQNINREEGDGDPWKEPFNGIH